MLTYQSLERLLMTTESGKKFSFPNFVEIEICLKPSEAFGVGNKSTRTITQGCSTNGIGSLHTGKFSFPSGQISEPIEAILEWSDQNRRLEMHGNKVYAKFECKDIKELLNYLNALHFVFPTLLAIELVEPPVVTSTTGRVGDVPFIWGLSKTFPMGISISSKERQENFVIDSFKRLIPVCIEPNRRLAAALSYYYVAKRLIEAGNCPQEFLAEAILNYYKVLEALFGDKYDTVRDGLQELGYSKDEIELNFIPVMILRNHFDVGHVTLSMFERDQLNELHNYLGSINPDFAKLLKLVINKVMDGSYYLKLDSNLEPSKDKQKKLNDLTNTFRKKAKREANLRKK